MKQTVFKRNKQIRHTYKTNLLVHRYFKTNLINICGKTFLKVANLYQIWSLPFSFNIALKSFLVITCRPVKIKKVWRISICPMRIWSTIQVGWTVTGGRNSNIPTEVISLSSRTIIISAITAITSFIAIIVTTFKIDQV